MGWTADGRWLVADSGGRLVFWDSQTRKEEFTLDVGIGTAVYTYVSPDRRYVAAACPGLTLIDVERRKVIQTLAAEMVERAAFTPDSKRLIAPVQGSLHVWSTADGAELKSVPLSNVSLAWVGVSPTGRLFAATDASGKLYLVDSRTYKTVKTVPLVSEDEGGIHLVGFGKEGRYLVTLSLEGTVRVFSSRGR